LLPERLSREDGVQTVTSADGTQIAYDRYCDDGPAVILISGALGYRKFKKFEQIAIALSEHCTVINYDRRGRGDSGEAGPVSVQHEVDDVAALIAAVGRLRDAVQDRPRRQVPDRRLRSSA
jgi:alpha-beta hydrolase superfamily lysophospholipase